MAHAAVKKWFNSGKYAQVNGSRVRPIGHPALKGELLSIQKGQAAATCLRADDGSEWILKKFHQGRALDKSYLVSVTSLLPQKDGFVAGTKRQVLSSDKLTRKPRCYYNAELARYLNDAILMPRVPGIDWACLADDVRDGEVQLSKQERATMCRQLTELVVALEDKGCSHRDFSAGNVFIDMSSLKVYLIDFDSFYHESLSMPKATTCGTVGYAPPFAWRSDVLDARCTWRPCADRYALALLVVEFCIIDRGAPITADGGIFNQDELRRRSGPGLDSARKALAANWPHLSSLFEAAIKSRDFECCPSPEDWGAALGGPIPKAPDLAQLEAIPVDYFRLVLRDAGRTANPLWRAPKLCEIPEFKVKISGDISDGVTLPPDPWR